MIALLMFVVVIAVLMAGYPVAFALGGTALLFAFAGMLGGGFDAAFLQAIPNRLFATMNNQTLIAVPLFVFMGVVLERSRVAENLLSSLGQLLGRLPAGLGLAVTLVGMLMAASTGIVGATVVTMGLLALPTLLRAGYDPRLATGTICAAGTLGQIIPPSIVLVLLGDVLSSAYQQAQLAQGIFATRTVSVGDLFAGALIPGLLLVAIYMGYVLIVARLRPDAAPAVPRPAGDEHWIGPLLGSILPPVLLIVAVLGSIMGGYATPTEAAAVGGMGSLLLALQRRQLDRATLTAVVDRTARITAMVFMIFIGASMFTLCFNAYGGDAAVHAALAGLPGGPVGAMIAVMLVMFLLGFIIDFIEITFVVVPIVAPPLLMMGLDPVWLGVMMAINLQTSFLTPPFGFALFYLRGVASQTLATADIYRGVLPFILAQVGLLVVLAFWPELATWLPGRVFGD